MNEQKLFAAAILDFDGDEPIVWLEFYWADDAEHAYEQATDSNPGTHAEISSIPYIDYDENS